MQSKFPSLYDEDFTYHNLKIIFILQKLILYNKRPKNDPNIYLEIYIEDNVFLTHKFFRKENISSLQILNCMCALCSWKTLMLLSTETNSNAWSIAN